MPFAMRQIRLDWLLGGCNPALHALQNDNFEEADIVRNSMTTPTWLGSAPHFGADNRI